MIVDSLRAIVAKGVGVGQRRTQKCDCPGSWKQNLDRNENEAKHLGARVLFSTNLRCLLSLLQLSGFQQLQRVETGKSFLKRVLIVAGSLWRASPTRLPSNHQSNPWQFSGHLLPSKLAGLHRTVWMDPILLRWRSTRQFAPSHLVSFPNPLVWYGEPDYITPQHTLV